MSNFYSIADAKDHLPKLVHEAEQGTTVEITRRGKLVAVLVSATEYARLTQPKKLDFQQIYQQWRDQYEAANLHLEEPTDPFEGVRDPSPSRDFTF